MPGQEETAGILAHLEAERRSGRLTITSSISGVCRVYLLMGQVFHAVGPAGEGDVALAAALSWQDATVSFDGRAHLPSEQTITAKSQARPSATNDTEASTGSTPVPRLSDNPRVAVANLAFVGDGCLFYLVFAVLIAGIFVSKGLGFSSDWVPSAAMLLLPAVGVLWIALYLRYRAIFVRAALEVDGGLAKADVPRVVDAPAGVIAGDPEFVANLPTRLLSGRVGKCRVELYAAGLLIWKGSKHPEPRWQFSYPDLLQAESVTLSGSGGRGSVDHQFVRLIVDRPRMVIAFTPSWATDRYADQLMGQLNGHGVRTFLGG